MPESDDRAQNTVPGTHPQPEQVTTSRPLLGYLGLILLVIIGTAAIFSSFLPGRQHTGQTGSVFTINAQPRAMPDVRFSDDQGQTVTLQDFRGKVVLINIWATWCPPCRKEMPALDRLRTQLAGPDFDVVALSTDQGQHGLNLVREFYLQTGITSLKIHTDTRGEASRNWEISVLPTTLLFDRNGLEIGRKLGAAEWDSAEIVAVIRSHMQAPGSKSSTPQ